MVLLLILAGHIGLGVFAVHSAKSERADQFLHFYRHSSTLVQLIQSWSNLEIYFTQSDPHLFRDVTVVASIVMFSAVGENTFVNLRHVPTGPEDEKLMERLNVTRWELYYSRSNSLWASLVPYHHAINLFLFFSDKLVLYAWTYTDLIIAVFSRALYFKFHALVSQGKVTLLSAEADISKWELFTRDFEILRRTINDINNFLSPMNFATFGINVYFLCLQVHNSVNPFTNATSVGSIYASWAVLQVAGRIFLVSVAAARINDRVRCVAELIRQCPDEFYKTEVQRTENFLNANVIGLSGLGCFTITKPMMLKVIGVIFSFEVVLIQALDLSGTKNFACSRAHN
ncbi:unnamed protein product [Allacma fusca]|uniref:Gustatory receptor n=1 Tax=Allacma fusca TaxID=39272 RepID=A0A8J2JCU5_9HEXA|nr:unnamed protein product [Allacma fusca]